MPPIGMEDFEVVVEVLPVVGLRFQFCLDLFCLGFDKSIQKVSESFFQFWSCQSGSAEKRLLLKASRVHDKVMKVAMCWIDFNGELILLRSEWNVFQCFV